jgi:hypothetical protein
MKWVSTIRSWKTTALGIVTALAILATEAKAALDDNPKTVINWEAVATAAGVLGIGIWARDSDVTSEQSGAK